MNETTHAPTTFTFGPPAGEAGGVLSIDLAAIADNWRTLRERVTPTECGAVVKGDGYGCGLEPVTALLYHAGCTTFVAEISEGKRVRRLAPEAVVYVLNGLIPETAPAYAEHQLRPVIGSMQELSEWDTFCSGRHWRGGMAIHVDTGMNRLGFRPEDAAGIAARLQNENHGIALLMSHFISSELPKDADNTRQLHAFREIRRMFRGVPSSIANSSGIFLDDSAHCDMVRPGVALYGGNPTPDKPNPMKPVIELRARVLTIRKVPRGETVGYNATWTASRPARIALIAIGYADGWLRSAGAPTGEKHGMVLVGDRLCPFVGRVSMDMSAIDVTDLPDGAIRRGDLVTLIGPGLDIDAAAEHAGTISYELMTHLGRRYARLYRGAAG